MPQKDYNQRVTAINLNDTPQTRTGYEVAMKWVTFSQYPISVLQWSLQIIYFHQNRILYYFHQNKIIHFFHQNNTLYCFHQNKISTVFASILPSTFSTRIASSVISNSYFIIILSPSFHGCLICSVISVCSLQIHLLQVFFLTCL